MYYNDLSIRRLNSISNFEYEIVLRNIEIEISFFMENLSSKPFTNVKSGLSPKRAQELMLLRKRVCRNCFELKTPINC